MATKKKASPLLRVPKGIVTRKTQNWERAFPDERNRFIDEARELIGAVYYTLDKTPSGKAMPDWMKGARRFLKETKP